MVRQPPADRPLLVPKAVDPFNRATPLLEIAHGDGAVVDKPLRQCSLSQRIDYGLRAATVPVPHSPDDRRFVVGRWHSDF